MFLRKLTLIMVFKTVFLANITIANESTSIPDIPSNAPRKHVPDPRELSNVDSRLQPLDNNLFGERIDYATGSVSFSVTDVTLPHSTLPIEVSRTLGGEQMSWRSKKDFRNWDLSIPHLRTKVAKFKEGGEVDYDYTKYSGNWPKGVACSRQPDLSNVRGRHGTVLSIYEYWAGETIEIPGKGSEIILRSNETNKITTKSQWDVSCADGGYGEGFIVTTLDGTKYEFFTPKYVQNKPVVKGKYEIAEYSEDGDCIFECETYKVATAYLLVDKITDKFGNWLKYDYTDGQLQSISSSDGRKVTFQYSNGLIASINANNRIWKYSYSSGNGSLHKVTRPDSSYWEYSDTYWYHRVPTPYTDHESSPNSPTLSRCVLTDVGMFDDLTITHPNGATGKFTFAERGFGRTSVTDVNTGRCFNNFSLIEKEITLSNDKAYKWSFKYLNSMGAFTSERKVSSFPGISNFRLPSIAGLVESDFKAVVVTNPDNSQHRYIHSRKYNWLENAMLSKEIIKDGETLKFEQYTYHQSNRRGIDKNFLSNTELNEYARLTKAVQISLFGADGNPHLYSSEVQEFNEYDQPNLIIYKTTQSDVEQKKYVKNSYTHDTENKVFNLPLTTEFSSDGKSYSQVSKKTYKSQSINAATVKVADKLYVNGQEVRTETNYDDNGNVTAIKFNQKLRGTQGNRYIEYSDFKFGKAQVITTPDRLTDKKLTLKLTFDDNGWLTSATDFNGTPTNYSYDEIGNLETINLENDSNTNWLDSKFVWNNTNNTRTIKRCTLTQGSKCSEAAPLVETVETYDSLLRLTQTKTIDNTINADATTSVRYQNFEYDYQNRQTLASFVSTDSADSTDSAELKGTRTTYDALGRTKTVNVSGLGKTKYEYLAGNKIKVTDPLSKVTTTTYQAFGAPEYEIATFIDSPENVDTSIAVNLFGQVEAITQSGPSSDGAVVSAVEKRVYDSNQNLCVITRPDVGNTIFGHNALGQMIWKKEGVTDTDCVATKPADAIEYVYDNVGDLYKINYPENSNTPSVTYTLDNNGNVTGLTAGDVTHSYVYNNQNLLEVEQLLINGQLPLEIDYGYNALQQREYLAYPDGTSVHFNPNGYGEPTRAVTYKAGTVDIELKFATDASYYANGMLKGFTYGNGVTHSLILDDNLLPDVLQDSRATKNIVKLDYSFDKGGNVTAILDKVRPTYSLTSLVYDDLHRLISVRGGTAIGNSSIKYDALGNIESYKSKDRNLTYTYDRATNRLSSVTGAGTNGKYANLTYDTRGNIDNNGAYQLNFNLANQLTSAKNNTYLYDGHNRRVKQVEQSGTSYSLYSQDGTLLYREKGNSITGEGVNYIYLGKKLIAKYGDVTPASEADSRQHYRPFGETLETPKDDVGYTGHKFDKELGLSYMQARYYDPVIGRFYSNDPIGFRDVHSFNRYAYANNNPYKYTDPDGENPKLIADFVLNLAVNKVTTGSFNIAGAAKETITGALNPAKTLKTANKLLKHYRGGAHSKVRGVKGNESHHMPADSASPLSKGKGPAISMDKADHKQTASWGSSKEAKAYRAQQKEMIGNGQFKEAQQMDIDDVQSKFGSKYDSAIKEMKDYTNKLDK